MNPSRYSIRTPKAGMLGGGVVLNQAENEGSRGKADAFGHLRVCELSGETCQLMDATSIYLPENKLEMAGYDPRDLRVQPQVWSAFGEENYVLIKKLRTLSLWHLSLFVQLLILRRLFWKATVQLK